MPRRAREPHSDKRPMVMNYMGSKARLMPFVDALVLPHVRPGDVFGDLFAGTGSVAAHVVARRPGVRIIANDAEAYSARLCTGLLCCPRSPELSARLAALQSAARGGLPGEVATRWAPPRHRFFTLDNAARIDGALAGLRGWVASGEVPVDSPEHAYLLGVLMAACGRCVNACGMYSAYLKQWWPRALAPLDLRPLPLVCAGAGAGAAAAGAPPSTVLHGDACAAARAHVYDVVYLDPPFTRRQYGRCYWFLNWLADAARGDLGDIRDIGEAGETAGGVPTAYARSPWAGARPMCKNALAALVTALQGQVRRAVFFAYSSDGTLGEADIAEGLSPLGAVTQFVLPRRHLFRPHRGVDAGRARAAEEWLFRVDCQRGGGARPVAAGPTRVACTWDDLVR